jgi:TraX protein
MKTLPRLVISESALAALKWLALVLMVIDHANKFLLGSTHAEMYAAGRVCMPLFALIVGYNLARPGMLESGAYARICLRLLAFGLLAFLPFVWLNKLPWGWWPLNIFFTLLAAVVAVWGVSRGTVWSIAAAVTIVVFGGAIVEFWWPALGLVFSVYAYAKRPSAVALACFVLCLMALYFVNGNFWALMAIPTLAVMHHWRWGLPRFTWVFYVFYPAHLWIFWWLAGMQIP